MNLTLCKGIAVIIDDKIFPKPGEPIDQIVKITKKINENGIPFCAYDKLSDAQKSIDNFGSVNFLILDWDLYGDLNVEDPEILIRPNHSGKVVKFIKDFINVCFCPIFIFSNANVSDIKDTLITNGLYFENKNNYIYVQAKKDLIRGNKLFNMINGWVDHNPTIYTLKNWENSFLLSKNSVFWHLFKKSPIWPRVLWQSFDEDTVDPQSNLNDIIYRLIKSRTSLSNLDAAKIKKRGKIDIEEVKDVIQGTMYIKGDYLPANDYSPGDIFKKNGNYYINIRPECDTIIGREGCDGHLYLLKGSKLTSAQFRKKHYHKKYGLLKDHNNFLLYGLDSKDFVRFNLKTLEIVQFNAAGTRLCRLLSPYVNDVQQQFSSYVGRFGLPRIPNAVLNSIK